MTWVGFEPTITASERAKIVHALDRATTVTGTDGYLIKLITLYNYIALSKLFSMYFVKYNITNACNKTYRS
jgi:hypothetical protein